MKGTSYGGLLVVLSCHLCIENMKTCRNVLISNLMNSQAYLRCCISKDARMKLLQQEHVST